MKYASLAVVLALLAAGCTSSSTPTAASSSFPTFTAQLQPAQETPAIANAEASASGTVTITFNTTKDASGNITSAVGTANITMQGFPAGSTVTLAHIHTGALGVAGPVLVPFVPSGTVTLTSGAGTFSQAANISGADATNIINNPSAFYFNVHTALNPGGVMRAQLVKVQ